MDSQGQQVESGVPVLGPLQEYIKQITSLSTWTILLSVGLVEKIFPSAVEKKLFAGAIGLFVISIVLALSLQLWVTLAKRDGWEKYVGSLSVICLLTFVGGLLLLLAFSWFNLTTVR